MNIAILWVSSLSWHLWRILTLRPAYRYLKDGPGAVVSFLFAYYAAGLLRNYERGPGSALIMLTVNLLVVLALFERRERSSILPLGVLGASAATDLVVALTMLLGWTPPTGVTTYYWSSILEATLVVRVIYRFFKLPPDKQRAEKRAWTT